MENQALFVPLTFVEFAIMLSGFPLPRRRGTVSCAPTKAMLAAHVRGVCEDNEIKEKHLRPAAADMALWKRVLEAFLSQQFPHAF